MRAPTTPPSLPPSLPQTPAHPHPPSMKETELTRENRNVSPNLKKKKKKDFRAMKSCDSDKEQISLGVFASFFGDFRWRVRPQNSKKKNHQEQKKKTAPASYIVSVLTLKL